jgi:hypothetical protein
MLPLPSPDLLGVFPPIPLSSPFPPAGGEGGGALRAVSLRGPLCPVAGATGQSFPLRLRNTRSGSIVRPSVEKRSHVDLGDSPTA